MNYILQATIFTICIIGFERLFKITNFPNIIFNDVLKNYKYFKIVSFIILLFISTLLYFLLNTQFYNSMLSNYKIGNVLSYSIPAGLFYGSWFNLFPFKSKKGIKK